MTGKNKIIKLISSILLIAIIVPVIFFSKPQKTHAQFMTHDWIVGLFTGTTVGTSGATAAATTTSTAVALKKVATEILQSIIMAVEKRLLASMTKSTVNWINSGFHGAPLFVENPKSFFKDIAKFQIKDFVDLTGYNSSKFPFGKAFALSTIGAYKKQFSDNAQYTLSKVIQDPNQLEKFRTDFDIGGWNGFLTNTQYPQNNYLGYRMLATEELARRLDGTAVSAANRVKETLNQGMGFLSPQTCLDNPNYNNGLNEFQKPTYKDLPYNPDFTVTQSDLIPDPVTGRSRFQMNVDDYAQRYKLQNEAERRKWADKNECKKLVSTTPGSVVANQITTALGSNFRQTELGAALGNSVSAIFDALLNKFLDDGLTALATKVNPKAPVDEWSYEGQTLGSPTDGSDDPWNSGPDEEISLSDFKKQIEGKTIVTNIITVSGATRPGATGTTGGIGGSTATTSNQEITTTEEVGNTGRGEYIPGDIANTNAELDLMYNETTCNPTITTTVAGVKTTQIDQICNPGLVQMLGKLWPKARELDICQPGPDLGWKDRTLKEQERNSKKLQGKVNDSDGEKAAQAGLALKELNFAVGFFKDWITNNMMKELPHSVLYMDAVDEIGTLAQQSDELTDRRRSRTQALARLEAIKAGLDAITRVDSDENIIQPSPGSADEKILISLKKQYNATRTAVSNSSTVDEIKNELTIAKEKLAKLNELVDECKVERTAKGWSAPTGPASTISGASEKKIYCDDPIRSGYDHESFRHSNDEPTFPFTLNNEIPYVNARDVMNWRSVAKTILTLGFGGRVHANIQLSCDIIWKATVLDYKGNLPGTTQILPPYLEPTVDDAEVSGLGTCDLVVRDDDGLIIQTDTQTDVTESQCMADTNNEGTWTANPPLQQSESEGQL